LGNVYLFCLLVGGFFVGAAALSGHDGDHDTDHALEHDAGHEFKDFGADAVDDFDADAPDDFDAEVKDFGAGDPLDLSIDLEAGAAEGFAGSLELDMESELAALPDSVDLDAEHAGDLILADAGGDADAGTDLVTTSGDAVWLPILSLRFWTYGSCFFGMTGLIIEKTALAGPALTLGVASGMGFTCGYTASWLFRKLRSDRGARAIGSRHYVGAIGTVLVTCGTEKTGKIRCTLRGKDFDLLARSIDKGDLPRGVRVLVAGFEDDTAQVVHAGRLLQHDDD
jgi:hypothetical protein